MFNKKKYLRSIRKKSFNYSDCFSKTEKIKENKKPRTIIFKTPEWFLNKNKVDVSVIVPLYKSSKEISEQINNWHFDEKYSLEIIYVDDCCPQNSYNQVLINWKQKNKNKIGNILLNKKNEGYGISCNKASEISKGEYLIFLNADCIVFDNWLNPIIDLLKNEKVGIVGNLQINKESKIDSAGSAWCWQTKKFQHIGRSIYKGQLLKEPFDLNNAPKEILQTQEREMVTGCCFGIRKDLFYDVGGFDKNYKIGYWEDADLCMRIKQDGYKILFEPKSIICHKGGHSGSCNHKHKENNAAFFYKRWVETNKINNLVKSKKIITSSSVKQKIIGCVIVCNEEEFLEAAVDSISSIIDRLIIVVGGNEYAYRAGLCDEKGYP